MDPPNQQPGCAEAHPPGHAAPPTPLAPLPIPFQAWALLEEEEGNVEEARRLLRRGSKVDPKHLYIWQAWGCLEYRQQNYDEGGWVDAFWGQAGA